MTNVDAEFIKDLETCLQVADQLSKLDTDEARLFVSEQLQNLHTFLQRKQKDAEDKIGEEIKKEEIEIAQLKKRIERATTSDGASESDVAYTDLNTLWSDLKENYWHHVFNAFIRETKLSVKDILDILINILKVCFTKCKERAFRSRTDMKFQVCYPGEKPSNKNLRLSKEQDQSLDSLCRICQLKSTPFCMASIQEDVVSEVKKVVGSISKKFKYESKDLSKAIENYLEKCVEFCWVACLEEPEIILVTEPNKECKKLASEFIKLDSTIYKSRATTVEWPAVVQGDKVRVQWQLYPLNQPRPEPKDLRGEQSLDYRVAGIEGANGGLMDDPDDKVNDDGKTTSDQSSDGTDKVKDETHKNTPVRKNDHSSVKKAAKENNNNKNKGYGTRALGHPNIGF